MNLRWLAYGGLLVGAVALLVGLAIGLLEGQTRRLPAALPTGTAQPSPDGRPVSTPPTGEPGVAMVRVGDVFQDVVDEHPVGTKFVIEAGVHRLQSVEPRDGDRFTGQPGAVMSGAKLLEPSAFARKDGRWVVGNQAQRVWMPDAHYEKMREDDGGRGDTNVRQARPEELFADGERLRHVSSLAAVDRPGVWFFDYETDEIWMFDDPSSFRALEASAVGYAFDGERTEPSDVTIENLEVRQYATRFQRGAINARGAADWTVRNVDSSFNHGVGLTVGPGMVVERSRFTNNGQLGIGGTASGGKVVVRDSEIARNRALAVHWRWEGGGTKFVNTRDMLFENNWVHHNRGPGAWWDIDNVDAVVRSNLVEHNEARGIFYEISYGARIYWNVVRHHGAEPGIYVSNSSRVEIFENALYGNAEPIYARQTDRGSGAQGQWETSHLKVHHNDVEIPSGQVGLRLDNDEAEYLWDRGSAFWANTYRTDIRHAWRWGSRMTAKQWRDAGNDTDGTFLRRGGTPALPSTATPFVASRYGAG